MNKTNKETLKELLLANMPPYPVKRSNLVDVYGKGVLTALDDLMAENKVLRAKRGYYILSDELLDGMQEYNGLEDEEERDFMPTETLKVIVSSWVSQEPLTTLLEKEGLETLKDVGYYTTSGTGKQKEGYDGRKKVLMENLSKYRHTEEGKRLVSRLTQ